MVLIQEPLVTGSGTFASLDKPPLRLITGYDPMDDDMKDTESRSRDSKSKRFSVRKADWDVFRQRLAEKLFDGRFCWLEQDLPTRTDYLTSAISNACIINFNLLDYRSSFTFLDFGCQQSQRLFYT